MAASKFPNTNVRYADTRECGGITVRGIQLETGSDGFIEGPADLAPEVEPHGFVREDKLNVEQRAKFLKAPVAAEKSRK